MSDCILIKYWHNDVSKSICHTVCERYAESREIVLQELAKKKSFKIKRDIFLVELTIYFVSVTFLIENKLIGLGTFVPTN